MSLSATYCNFEVRAVVWGMWKSGVITGRWAALRGRVERRRPWRAPPQPVPAAALEEQAAMVTEPVQRRCQARGCSAIFATMDMAELRCPGCRSSRRRVPPLEASHCGCAAAMCAGV